jgi:Trypsin-co-occurring domain 2
MSNDSNHDGSSIGLAELISQIKKELAIPPNGDSLPTHFVESIDLDLQVIVKKEGNSGFKLTVPFFDALGVEAGGRLSRDQMQSIKVKLSPLYDKKELLELYRKLHPGEALAIMEETMHRHLKNGSQQTDNLADRFKRK